MCGGEHGDGMRLVERRDRPHLALEPFGREVLGELRGSTLITTSRARSSSYAWNTRDTPPASSSSRMMTYAAPNERDSCARRSAPERDGSCSETSDISWRLGQTGPPRV